MNIFFAHQKFPAHFLNLVKYLAKNPENNIYFLTETPPAENELIPNVNVEVYQKSDRYNELFDSTKNIWPLIRMVNPITRGMAVMEALEKLNKEKKIRPDILIGHAGCGALIYCKDLFPNLPVIGYFEWFQRIEKTSANYLNAAQRTNRISNRTHHFPKLMSLALCDAAVTATEFQYARYPEVYQPKFHVIHEGIDTRFCSPDPSGKRPGLVLDDIKLNLPADTEIITYVARNLDLVRGFTQFMDSIRLVLANRPKAHVVVVGEDRAFKDTTYLNAEKNKGGYPADRVHFVGLRSREDYQKILRASACHVYLTIPFVLSQSCLEAMSFACPVVGSDTLPVQEVIEDGVNGLLAEFRSPHHIARKIENILDDPERAKALGTAARETILKRFELNKCLEAWEDLIYKTIH